MCLALLGILIDSVIKNTWFFVPFQNIKIQNELGGFSDEIIDNINNTMDFNKRDQVIPVNGYIKDKIAAINCSDLFMRQCLGENLLFVTRKVFYDETTNLWIVLYRRIPFGQYLCIILNGQNCAVIGITSQLHMDVTNIK